LLGELAPRDADDAVAGDRELPIAFAVGLERARGQVGGGAVGLDDQARGRPAEVDHVACHDHIDLWARQVVVGDQREHALFELAPGGLRAGAQAFERGFQCLRATAVERGQPGAENGGIEEAGYFRAVQGALEPVRGEDVREVDQRPRRRGCRESVDGGDVRRGERAGAVHADPFRRRAAAQRRDVDRAARRGDQLPQRGGRAMTDQGRTGPAAREYRRPQAGPRRQPRVTGRVHAAMTRMQPPAVHPPLDRARPDSDREQLGGRDHPLLAPSQRGDRRIAR